MTSPSKDRHHNEETFLRHGHETLAKTHHPDPGYAPPCPAPKAVAEPTVLNTIQTWDRFCALSIKVDTTAGAAVPADTDAALMDLIETGRENQQAVGCRWAEGLYLCALPVGDIERAREFAGELQKQLSRRRPETVTIGIAGFPQLTFSRGQALINTCKALDHAAFFGPGSVVIFDATSLNISGDKHYHADELDLAAAEYRTGLELNPRDANLHNSLAICQAEHGDMALAAASFTAALEIDPGETMAIYNLGMVALLRNDPGQALSRFEQAYAQNREIFEIPFQIGKLLLEQNDWAGSLAYLEEAAALNDRNWQVFNLKGACLARLGEASKAIKAYSQAVKINPNDAEGLSALGCLYDERGENPELCEAFFQQSIRLAPRNGLYYHRLGRWHRKQRQSELAREAFRQASALGHDASQEIASLEKVDDDAEDPTVRCA